MFTIQDVRFGKYVHWKGQILIFETREEAQYFLENFINFSIQYAIHQNPFLMAEVQTMTPHIQIFEVKDPAALSGITFKDFMENRNH